MGSRKGAKAGKKRRRKRVLAKFAKDAKKGKDKSQKRRPVKWFLANGNRVSRGIVGCHKKNGGTPLGESPVLHLPVPGHSPKNQNTPMLPNVPMVVHPESATSSRPPTTRTSRPAFPVRPI